MYRFFYDSVIQLNQKIEIEGKDFHHIRNVLRLKEGESIQVACNRCVYNAEIDTYYNDHMTAMIISEDKKRYESPLHIHLYQSMLKNDKLEWVIQKCVELGVQELTLLNTSRVIVKYDEKKIEKKIKRYENIIESASKQSKRISFMKIHPPANLRNISALSGSSLVCYENESLPIKTELKDLTHINLFIGPEGGFSEDEIQFLKSIGARSVSLGNRILRAETAAIAACTVLQYELGDLNG